MERIIFHIDVNNAFLSWTAIYLLRKGYKIDIRNIPSVIGGDEHSRHGIVLAKSTPAKKLGINTPEPIYQAKKKCPNLKIFKPNYKWYQYMSNKLFEYLSNYTDEIEVFSIDECFLDYTSIKHIYGDELEFAKKISNEIKEKFRFTVNIGIANNKLCAKMASDFSKPDKIHTLYSYEVEKKMHPLPIEEMLWIGKKTSEKLKNLKINTIGDLAHIDPYYLSKYFKNTALKMIQNANGIDNSIVEKEATLQKGIGAEVTLLSDLDEIEDILNELIKIVDKVVLRLRNEKRYATTVVVVLKDKNFKKITHQRKLKNATNNTDKINQIVKELLYEMKDFDSIRLVGVRLEGLTDILVKQVSIFDNEKEEDLSDALQKAIDDIKIKYGKDLKYYNIKEKMDKND